MRFMIIGRATKETEAGVLPKPEAFEAMQKYNEELVKSGILLEAVDQPQLPERLERSNAGERQRPTSSWNWASVPGAGRVTP